MRRAVVTLALALAISGAAHAETKKSKNLALALGGVGTGISASLLFASVVFSDDASQTPVNKPLFISGLASSIITPSLGQYYAGDYLTIGMGIRGLSGIVAGYAALFMTETHKCTETDHAAAGISDCTQLTQQAVVVLGLAAIGYIGGVAYDLSATPDAVASYNKRHGFYMGVARAIDQHTIPTVGIGGTF